MKNLKMLFWLFVPAFIIGTIFSVAKVAMVTFSFAALLGLRYAIAGVGVYPSVRRSKGIGWEHFKNNFLPSLLAVLNPLSLFYALKFVDANKAVLLYATQPLLTIIALMIFERKKPTIYQLIGMIVGFFGVYYTISSSLVGGDVSDVIKGSLCCIVGVSFFTGYTLISNKRRTAGKVTPDSLIFYSGIIAVPISIFFMLFSSDNFIMSDVYIMIKTAVAVLWLGVICTMLFFQVYQYVLKEYGSVTIAFYTYFMPISGVIFAYLLLGESLTSKVFIGGLLIIAGLWVANRK